MILRNQVEWALHCCSVLAAAPEGTTVATKDLAEFHGVPKEYLSKALQSLSNAGLLEGTLGPSGGYRLKRPPAKISFLDVVEAVEGQTGTFACTNVKDNNPCLKKGQKTSKLCAIARVMYRADEAWRRELASMSLEDLGTELLRNVPKELLLKAEKWFARGQ